MNQSRRDLIQLALAAGTVAAARGLSTASPLRQESGDPKLNVLILGGTAFLGPAIVEACKARGHTITLFNRGKTNPQLFPELEKLRGDRDPTKGEGLKALEGRKFDVVFDDCGYYPRMVEASAKLLAPNVKQYVFVSTLSVYADEKTGNADETAATGKIADPTIEAMGKDFENYGPLKALCEQAAEAAMPGRVANVRPGYIVGPGDWTNRFNYWPARFDKGGEIAVPGDASDAIQIIDVRDLAEWLVHLAEKRTTGVFNATGPASKLGWGEVITACTASGVKGAQAVWIPWDYVNAQEGVQFPICLPSTGDYAGFHTRSVKRAVDAGLKFRPAKVTVADSLAWFKGRPAEEQEKLWKQNLSTEAEQKLIADWRSSKKS